MVAQGQVSVGLPRYSLTSGLLSTHYLFPIVKGSQDSSGNTYKFEPECLQEIVEKLYCLEWILNLTR